jgi:hypothetical protein
VKPLPKKKREKKTVLFRPLATRLGSSCISQIWAAQERWSRWVAMSSYWRLKDEQLLAKNDNGPHYGSTDQLSATDRTLEQV